MSKHRLTWRMQCAVTVDADSRQEAIDKAIALMPPHIPVGTELHYGMASGSSPDAVYVKPAQEYTWEQYQFLKMKVTRNADAASREDLFCAEHNGVIEYGSTAKRAMKKVYDTVQRIVEDPVQMSIERPYRPMADRPLDFPTKVLAENKRK